MNCSEFRKMIPRALDGELGPADTRALEAHVAGCPSCAGEHAAEESLKALFRPVAVDPPPGLRPRILAALETEAAARRAVPVIPIFRRAAVAALLFLALSAGLTFFQPDTLTAGNRDGEIHYEDVFALRPPGEVFETLISTTDPEEALHRLNRDGRK